MDQIFKLHPSARSTFQGFHERGAAAALEKSSELS